MSARIRNATVIVILFLAPLAVADDAFSPARDIIADIERIVTPNGVQEMFAAEIGGIEQWISTRGRDRSNPLLLFVHGGPAAPAMPWAWTFQRPWEEYFTVVQWDQRAAGKTYVANDPAEVAPTIHIDRYVADTLEVIELLRERYGKRKIVLVAHSWGTIIALRAAIEKPEWIHAYVGIGQVISVEENERVSYEFALETARRVYELARELGIAHIRLVANKVRDADESEAIRAFAARHDLHLAAEIPFDEAVLRADLADRSLLDVAGPDSPAVREIQ
ncbi:MAG: alpha/beta fold hydrolase, partial [Proteobacteria bacterium]|nr:alpha/beta fold hydrolase [Pseudomonadota bacterium]